MVQRRVAEHEGAGATTIDVVRGQAGGVISVSNFHTSTDKIDLFGYTAAQQAVSSEPGGSALLLSDGTRIDIGAVFDITRNVVG